MVQQIFPTTDDKRWNVALPKPFPALGVARCGGEHSTLCGLFPLFGGLPLRAAIAHTTTGTITTGSSTTSTLTTTTTRATPTTTLIHLQTPSFIVKAAL